MKILLQKILLILIVLTISFSCSEEKPIDIRVSETIKEFNKAYQEKDIDKWLSFFSDDFMDRANQVSGGISKWKQNILDRQMKPWQELHISSVIKNVEVVANTILVMEEMGIEGRNWLNKMATIKKNGKRFITLIDDGGDLKIENIRDGKTPKFYSELNSDYSSIGKSGLIYVSHLLEDYISVINSENLNVIGKIDAGVGTIDVKTTKDQLFVLNYYSNSMSVIDKSNNQIIQTVKVGNKPSSLLIVEEAGKILISHETDEGTFILDLENYNTLKTIKDTKGKMVYNEKDKLVYQAQKYDSFINSIDLTKLEVVDKLDLGGQPVDICFNKDFSKTFVANHKLNEVDILDEDEGTILRINNVDGPRSITLTNDEKKIIITNVKKNSISLVNYIDKKIEAQIPVGQMPVASIVSSNSNLAYIVNQASNSISVIELNNYKVIKTIWVAEAPTSISID